MSDRKEVMSWLEGLTDDDWQRYHSDSEVQTIAKEAFALLKEQEPKQIVRKQGKHENSDGSIDYFGEWYCPHCGKLLCRGFDAPWIEFCYKCGRPVKF